MLIFSIMNKLNTKVKKLINRFQYKDLFDYANNLDFDSIDRIFMYQPENFNDFYETLETGPKHEQGVSFLVEPYNKNKYKFNQEKIDISSNSNYIFLFTYIHNMNIIFK